MKPKLLRLHPQDNIVVATAPIKAQSVLKLDRVKIQIVSNVPMAGKVATRPIAEGEKIIKFGQPIGHATRNIEPGEWVHTHNLASDYLPTPERTPLGSEASREQSQGQVEIDSSQAGSRFVQSEPSGPRELTLPEDSTATSEARSSDTVTGIHESETVEQRELPGSTPGNPSQPEEGSDSNDTRNSQVQG